MIEPPEAAPFEQLIAADKLVHEPARLAVLTALAACDSADFVFLQRLTCSATARGRCAQFCRNLSRSCRMDDLVRRRRLTDKIVDPTGQACPSHATIKEPGWHK